MMLELLGAAIMVAMFATAGLMLHLDTRRRAARVEDRIDSVTLAYLPGRVQHAASRRPMTTVANALVQRWESLLGYRRLRQPHYSASLRRVLLIAMLPTFGACYMLAHVAGNTAWGAAPVLWIGLVRFYYTGAESRLGAKLYNQFPDALGMIVRAVRVGVPVTEAVRMVSGECQAPTTIEFRQLSDEVAIGVPLDQALRQMGARNRLPEYRFFATALALQSQTGGGLTETLETLADTIRKRVAARSRGHALASEARTSCYMLAVLPVIVGAGLYATNPDYMSVLFTTSGGNKLLALGVASLATGLFSMRMIIRKSLS